MRPALLAFTTLVLVLSACSGEGESTGGRDLKGLTPVVREVVTQPDRDRLEVERKLAALDPCLLFDARVARRVGDAMGSRRYGSMHSCQIGSTATTTAKLAVALTSDTRFYQGRHNAAGAVSYRTTTTKRSCTVSLAVTQTVAIEFNSWERRCADTVRYAEAAAQTLRTDPGRLLRPRDAGRFTACQLLTPAVPTGWQIDPGNRGAYSLHECTASTTGRPSTSVRLFLDISAAAPEQRRISGECWTDFTLPQLQVRLDSALRGTATLVTDSCDRARRMIPAVLARARRTPPVVEPTNLLYAWDPTTPTDLASTGACADIVSAEARECTPALPAEVPGDTADLLERAEADPDVLCAALTPLVHQWYGDSLRPATVLTDARERAVAGAPPTACAFGEPTHAVHITIVASTQQQLLTEEEEIAGHPAATMAPSPTKGVSPMRRFTVGWRAQKPGVLTVTVLATPTRQKGNWQGIAIDQQPVETADGFVTDVVETLLG